MFLRKAATTIAIALMFCSNAAADRIVLPAVDRDRDIKLPDGRIVRLPAGKVLIKRDNGKYGMASVKPKTPAKPTAKAPAKPAHDATRWIWFAGLDALSQSVARDYKVNTDQVNCSGGTCDTIEFEGNQFSADGGTHSFSKDESMTSFGIEGGIKDEQEQNYYYGSFIYNKDLMELIARAQFGFPSIAFMDKKIVPFARASVGMSWKDDLGEPDAVVFGAGIGVTYLFNKNLEFFGGLDYVMRDFGDTTGKASASSGNEVTFGTVAREEKETQIFVGARWLFR